MNDAAARDGVRRLRRTVTVHGAWIFPVIVAEANLTFADGKFGWGVFWAVLLVLTMSLWTAGVVREHRRDGIVLAGTDAAVRAYLFARLKRAAETAKKLGPWPLVGGAFLVMGVADLVRTDRAPAPLHAAENLLLGAYFVGSRVYARFVLSPRFARLQTSCGDPGPDAGLLLMERVRAVAAAMGEVQGFMMWRETTGASIREAKTAVRGLLYGASAPKEPA